MFCLNHSTLIQKAAWSQRQLKHKPDAWLNLKPRVDQTARGFTLIELLVVLVIIALILSVAIFSTGNSFHRKLLQEAERLQSVVMAAGEEAIYKNQELGIYFQNDGYSVVRLNKLAKGWVSLDNRSFNFHRLPDGMKVEWQVEGFSMQTAKNETRYVELDFNEIVANARDASLEVDLDETDTESLDDTADNLDSLSGSLDEMAQVVVLDIKPQVFLLSSGEQTAFEVDFGSDSEKEDNSTASSVRLKSDGFSIPYLLTLQSNDEEQE